MLSNTPAQSSRTRLQWLVIVVCSALALVLRLYYVNVTIIDHPVRGDAISYYAYAWNLLHSGTFSHVIPGSGLPIADSYRDPGYPLLMAVMMRLAGDEGWYPALLDLQAFLGTATVFLALVLGKRWLPWPWLAIAGVLMAIWPHSITSASYLLTETLCGFLVTLGVVLVSLPAAGNRVVAFAAGLVIGAAGLTNAILLPFGLILVGFLAASRALPRAVIAMLLIGSLLLPGAWALRNASLPAATDATTTTSVGRAMQNLVQGSWPEYHSAWRESLAGNPGAIRIMDQINREITRVVADSPRGLHEVAQRLASNPLHYLGWYLRKPALLWGWSVRMGAGDVFIYPAVRSPYLTNTSFMFMAAIAHALNPVVFLCAAIFCVLTLVWPAMRGEGRLPCVVLLLYVTAVYWVLQSEPRYSIPFRPLQALAGVAMLSWLWRHAMNRRKDFNKQLIANDPAEGGN